MNIYNALIFPKLCVFVHNLVDQIKIQGSINPGQKNKKKSEIREENSKLKGKGGIKREEKKRK